jgi:hypothetical protein
MLQRSSKFNTLKIKKFDILIQKVAKNEYKEALFAREIRENGYKPILSLEFLNGDFFNPDEVKKVKSNLEKIIVNSEIYGYISILNII